MEDFTTSLVREKIVFTDSDFGEIAEPGKEPVVIRSNRIFLKLGGGPHVEKVVIRAQTMHTTLRLAAKILFSYFRHGLILPQGAQFDWDAQWESVLSAYEKEFNPNNWAAIYINGKPAFKTITSPFVDVIEKCALLTIDNYDATMEVTENALKQIGHAMHINHSSNVAAVLSDAGDSMRCGIIHRSASNDTTFNFTAAGGERHNRIVQAIGIVAAYLEVFNLRYTLHKLQPKLRAREVGKASHENSQIRAAILRRMAASKAIDAFEEIYEVHYRPAKPDIFSDI